MGEIVELAPAKVNLTLHIRGRREDGYHTLESLIAFADIADCLTFDKAPTYSLTSSGPFASRVPQGEDNIVLTAARSLAHGVKTLPPGAVMDLEKVLPVAAGIGGGSADAAACLRGLLRLHETTVSPTVMHQVAVGIGADVNVCLRSQVALMTGIGHVVEPAPELPLVPCVLVNPGVSVSTAAVFSALGLAPDRTFAVETPPPPRARFRSVGDLVNYLLGTRNDLEAPASEMVGEIGDVQNVLFACDGCMLSRMTGSGATCFGIFETQAEAEDAAGQIRTSFPDWWVAATTLH